MIISRTPFRISFFGGGTDFPKWYKEERGKVISTCINKHCYISARILPPFFKYNYRLRYFKKEEVKKISLIKHPSIRETIKYLNFSKNLEIVHHADLPAQSGLGASSSFTVGMINSLIALQGKRISKKNLAMEALKIEQQKIKEYVGSQDQFAASFGGFNIINFNSNKIDVSPVPTTNKNLDILEKSIFLVFSGHPRNAQVLEKKKINNIKKNSKFLKNILEITDQAEKKLYNSKNIVSDFSELIEKYWWYKIKLSNDVTNPKIDRLMKIAFKNGAYSGKLVGAGGGGFLMFLIDHKKREHLTKIFKKFTTVPIRFEHNGSQIIYYQDNQ
ncbi:kinase [bacterium]|nr:kinase [bacterium]